MFDASWHRADKRQKFLIGTSYNMRFGKFCYTIGKTVSIKMIVLFKFYIATQL